MAVSGWGIFLILLVVVMIFSGIAWVLYSYYRANKLGLPPPNLNPFANRNDRRNDPAAYRAPAPAPGGIQGWVSDRWNSLRSIMRMTGGAYESTGYVGGRSSIGERRGLGPLDPDEAWDARIDHEMGGYYEEQELGMQDPSQGPYGGGGYGSNVGVGGIEEGRGRSRSRQRELDVRYDEEMHAGGVPAASRSNANPFGDGAEDSNMSLRSMSPRPDAGSAAQGKRPAMHTRGPSGLTVKSTDTASLTERRSMFRENM